MQAERKKNPDLVDLDTAISMTGIGKFHLRLGLVTGGCLAATTTDNLGNSFVLPFVQCEWGLSATEKGLYSGATFLGMIIAAYCWGFTSDTFGRRKVLILSLGFGWLTSFCASLVPTFWMLVLFRFLAGAGIAGMGTTIYAYLMEFLPSKESAKYLSWCSILNGAVYSLIPATAWLILPLSWSLDLGFVVITSWRLLCLLNGFYVLITFFGMLSLPESPKYLVSVEKSNEALDVLRKVFSVNTGRPESEYPVRGIINTAEDIRTVKIKSNDKLSLCMILKSMKNQIAPIFGRNHLKTTILGCVYEFSVFSSACGFYLWMPDILHKMMSYHTANANASATICEAISIRLAPAVSNTSCQPETDSMVYLGSVAIGINYCVGFVLVGFLVNVMGNRALLAVIQLISGLAGFGLYWASSSISVIIFSAIYIAQSGISITLLSSVLLNLYPTHLRSAALCIAMSIGRLGSSLTGFLIGIFMEKDCGLTILGLGAMPIGTVILSFLIPAPPKTVELVT